MNFNKCSFYALNFFGIFVTNETTQPAHTKAAQYLQDNPPQQVLSAMHLGRLRLAIKKHLATEMEEIDGLVKKIVG